MKNSLLIALTAIGFTLLLSTKLQAQAQVNDYHFDFDLAGHTYYTCDGTSIDLQGTGSFDLHFVHNKNKLNSTEHVTATGSGLDLVGNTYIFKENLVATEQVTPANGSFTLYINVTLRAISQGSAPNFSIHQQFKVTYINGVYTYVLDRFTTSCD